MSPRRRNVHEHLPHTFEEVIEVIAKGKPKDKKEIKKKGKRKS